MSRIRVVLSFWRYLHANVINYGLSYGKEDKYETIPVNPGLWVIALWKRTQDPNPPVGNTVASLKDNKHTTSEIHMLDPLAWHDAITAPSALTSEG
jgi:hypothetical protein